MSLQISPVKEQDLPTLLEMIRELAEFEELLEAMVATEEDYRKALFSEAPAAEAVIASWDGAPVGYAIFFSTFSSFKGRAGIWLEDLYVRPDFRKRGIGKALLRYGAKLADQRNAGRYEWCVLDWNQNAIDFYEKAGADVLPEWRIVRTEGDTIRKMANN